MYDTITYYKCEFQAENGLELLAVFFAPVCVCTCAVVCRPVWVSLPPLPLRGLRAWPFRPGVSTRVGGYKDMHSARTRLLNRVYCTRICMLGVHIFPRRTAIALDDSLVRTRGALVDALSQRIENWNATTRLQLSDSWEAASTAPVQGSLVFRQRNWCLLLT